jgi:dTDP-4-dehydrorhamnose reductase
MARPQIFVTGSNGQLGSELKVLAGKYNEFEFHFYSRADFPVDDVDIANQLFEKYQPSFFINCAAYTAVDKAETEKEQAKAINGKAPGSIAALCSEFGTKLIHVSTDYVFDGEANSPLKEDDMVSPVNFYGESKLLGEKLVQKNDPSAIIIRTSWVYSSYGRNFVKTMMRLMNEKESIGVVNDQVGSPTYAADLAEAIMMIISSGKWHEGIYHYSNEGVISWFDFATAIRDLIHSSCVVNPITTEQFPTPAKRPKYSVLDKSKIKQAYSLELKEWRESLEKCIDKIGVHGR